MTSGWILTLNAGSSSLKYAAFRRDGIHINSGQITNIGPDPAATSTQTHGAALSEILAKLNNFEGPLWAVGHRVVHGGSRTNAAKITPAVLNDITQAATLAPLHNPPALHVIKATQSLHPNVPQVACFDTAFHAQNPVTATTIALPKNLRDSGIRRYGFHGLSYAGIVRRFTDETGQPLPRRLLALHLGAGASMAAINNGIGVATTMGFSPLDGLVMATRGGTLDPGVLLHLMRSHRMNIDQIDTLLNHQSGLLALAGSADMKTILATNTPESQFAIEHYCYWVNRHAGSMIAAMNGIDGVVFTGGIGENAKAIRTKIMENLTWAGNLPHWVIPADEQGEIALLTQRVLA